MGFEEPICGVDVFLELAQWADVFVEKDGETINAKSIMGLMMLAAGPGSKLLIIANGPDAEDAVRAIEELIAGKFGEE